MAGRPGNAAVIVGVLHHGVTVSNIYDSVVWYQEALGLELVHRQRQENVYTPVLVGVPGAVLEVAQLRFTSPLPRVSTHDVELIEYVEHGLPTSGAPVNSIGTAHLAFLVEDIVGLYERVRSRGGEFRNPPVQITEGTNLGGWGCYLHDPDGNTLEFIQPAAERLEHLRALFASF